MQWRDKHGSRPRILVTRAVQGGSVLAEHLEALGLEPVLVPVIQTAPPESFTELDTAIRDLDGFDWAVFTSANGVDAFVKRRQQLDSERASLPAQLRIAAIGPATSKALAVAGMAVALAPPQAVAESLAAALLPHARRRDGSPARFLLIRPEEAREVLPEVLRAAGAEVTLGPAYRTVIPAESVEQIQALFNGTDTVPQAVTFTSASTVRNLLSLCESARIILPDTMLRVSIGPITTQALREHGLPPHAEAAEASVASLAQAVLTALRQATGANTPF